MGATRIEWAEKVWNPVTGCTPVSAGCDNCYAKRMAQRLRGRAGYPADDPFRVTLHEDHMTDPVHWRKPSRVFVCSMGDLFHHAVSVEVLKLIWTTMEMCPRHTFCLLTKRPERMRNLLSESGHLAREHFLPNVWLGVTVEDRRATARIRDLQASPAAVRFLSCEPLLESLGTIDLRGIGWVIAGGETGPGPRLMHPDWVRSLRDQCLAAEVPFFFKSYGSYRLNCASSRVLDGRTWDEFPEVKC